MVGGRCVSSAFGRAGVAVGLGRNLDERQELCLEVGPWW